MSRGISQKTKRMTVSAMLAALGVALLFISGLIETLDLSMAALASFFCIFAVIELGGAYPWLWGSKEFSSCAWAHHPAEYLYSPFPL